MKDFFVYVIVIGMGLWAGNNFLESAYKKRAKRKERDYELDED